VSESRQRWRIVFARDEEARFLSHLDASHAWERSLRRGGVPVTTSEGFSPRPKLIFAAPLPLGMLAEHDLADLFLAERLTRPELREQLTVGMPRGYRLLDLYDIWVGAPALATQLAAADYRLTLLGVDADRLGVAIRQLLAAHELRREKRREKKVTAYDLRPLLLDLRVRSVDEAAAGEVVAAGLPEAGDGFAARLPAAGLWMRLRHSQVRGSGRAEEVVAALAENLGLAVIAAPGAGDAGAEERPERASPSGPSLEIVHPVRERLWLAEELDKESVWPDQECEPT
jgi:radical SAM-linked protein